MAKDHYAILGVPRTATREEIEAAYRKMSQLYNPEVNGEAFAANIYLKVLEARDILMDEEKRRAYDAGFSSESVTPQPVAEPVRPVEFPAGRERVSPPQESSQSFSAAWEPAVGNVLSGTAPNFDQRAFYAEQFRAEKKAASTFQDWLFRREALAVILGSILLIDGLAWLFGLRLPLGGTFGFFFRSSSLVFLGWAGYCGLRYYTDNVFFGLGYSLFFAVIYAVFIVRIYLDPGLYPGASFGSLIGRLISVHFVIFYLIFFCAAQCLEDGGIKTVYDRALGRR